MYCNSTSQNLTSLYKAVFHLPSIMQLNISQEKQNFKVNEYVSLQWLRHCDNPLSHYCQTSELGRWCFCTYKIWSPCNQNRSSFFTYNFHNSLASLIWYPSHPDHAKLLRLDCTKIQSMVKYKHRQTNYVCNCPDNE